MLSTFPFSGLSNALPVAIQDSMLMRLPMSPPTKAPTRAPMRVNLPCFAALQGLPTKHPTKVSTEVPGLSGPISRDIAILSLLSRAAKQPSLSFFVLLGLPRFSGIFPTCPGMVRGFSRFVPFLFLGLLSAPTRNSPERVRSATQSGPFPKKMGNPPVNTRPKWYDTPPAT